MSRTRVRRRRLGAALLGLGVVAGFAATGASASGHFQGEERPAPRQRYVVKTGDTLWAIAERRARGEDPRPLIDAIAEANELDGAGIVPGQTLIVPMSP